jgi:hypothetical protein
MESYRFAVDMTMSLLFERVGIGGGGCDFCGFFESFGKVRRRLFFSITREFTSCGEEILFYGHLGMACSPKHVVSSSLATNGLMVLFFRCENI